MSSSFWKTLSMALSAGMLLVSCAVQNPKVSQVQPSDQASSVRDRVTESDESAHGRRARVRLELATAYYSRGQLITALDEVKLSIALDSNNPSAFNLRGLIYAGLNDDKLAQESFRRALEINNSDADTLQNYGWYLCSRQQYAQSEIFLKQALLVPNYEKSFRTLITLATCQMRQERLSDAQETLDRAFKLEPSNPVAAFHLGDVLFRLGEFERARFFIRRVNASSRQSNADSLWLEIRIEHKLGNIARTHVLGRELIERFPKSNEAIAFERGEF